MGYVPIGLLLETTKNTGQMKMADAFKTIRPDLHFWMSNYSIRLKTVVPLVMHGCHKKNVSQQVNSKRMSQYWDLIHIMFRMTNASKIA